MRGEQTTRLVSASRKTIDFVADPQAAPLDTGRIFARLDDVAEDAPGDFTNCIFMNVRTVDAHSYGGGHDLERLRQQADEALTYFVAYCHHHGLAAKAYLSFGTDPIEELTRLAENIYEEFPHSIFFTSKLISSMTIGTSVSCTVRQR
jgi:hypothetical protein